MARFSSTATLVVAPASSGTLCPAANRRMPASSVAPVPLGTCAPCVLGLLGFRATIGHRTYRGNHPREATSRSGEPRSFRRLGLAPDQRDETDRQRVEKPRPFGGALEHAQLLVATADRQGNPPAVPELLQQRRGQLSRGRGHGDAIVRRALGQAEPAVADMHVYALVARSGERNPRRVGELRNPLD